MPTFILLCFLYIGVLSVPDITVITSDGEAVSLERYYYHEEFFNNMQKQLGSKVRAATETWLRYSTTKSDELLTNIDANQYLFLQILHSLISRDTVFTNLLLEQYTDAFSDRKPILNEWVRSNLKLPIDVMYRMVDSVANAENFGLSKIPELITEEILLITNKSEVFLESCKKGDMKTFEWILKTGIDFDLGIPLEVAWQNEKWDIVKVLIQNGALKTIKVQNRLKNTGNVTLLHLMAEVNAPEVVSVLANEGSAIDVVNTRGSSPLYIAIDKNNIDAAKILLSNGAEANLKTSSGNIALHAAASNGNLNAVRLLLDQDSSIYEKNNLGLAPLDIADHSGIFYIVKYLLQHNIRLPSTIISDTNLLPYFFFMSEYGKVRKEDDTKQIENYCEIAEIMNNRASRVHENDFMTKLLDLLIENRIPLLTQCAINLGGKLTITNENNETLLFNAVRAGSYEIVRLLLNEGVDINVKGVNDTTALHVAARSGMLDIVIFLIKRGADLNAVSNEGFTALHEAAKGGHNAVVNYLLEKGIRVDTIKKPNDKVIYETPLQLAASQGHLKVVKNLLNRGIFNDVKANETWTTIHAAARAGHENIVRLLLDRGYRVDVADNEGKTPLFWASFGGNVPTVMTLLQRGANIHTKSNYFQRPTFGHAFPIVLKSVESPLHVAALNGHKDLCRILIDKGIDKDIKDAVGATPLLNAVTRGHYNVAKFLLEIKASKTSSSTTTLHEAASGGHLDIIDLLIDKGLDPDVKNYRNETPLYVAAMSGQLGAVEFLIENMADVNAVNTYGQTPLTAAVIGGHYEVALLLLDNGAKVNVSETLLTEAVSHGFENITQLLIDRGALLNFKPKTVLGFTPLHLAVDNPKMVQLLLDNNADVNAESASGTTPLFVAVSRMNDVVVRLLINSGQNPDTNNSRNGNNWSCLHMAASHLSRSLKNVELLLDNGAYIDPLTNEGYTPLHFAIRRGYYDIAKMLLDRGANVNIKNSKGENTYRIAKDTSQTSEDDYKNIANLRLCDCNSD